MIRLGLHLLRSSARIAWELRDPEARASLRRVLRFAVESPENAELAFAVALLVVALGFRPVGGGVRRD